MWVTATRGRCVREKSWNFTVLEWSPRISQLISTIKMWLGSVTVTGQTGDLKVPESTPARSTVR